MRPCSQSCNVRAYASQYLQEPSKALIDDVVKVMDAPPDRH
ncbi:hypothetical protein DMX03_03895 [Pseudomonas koreensis]|nr:DUF3077 domain-containing protein [Pseudomonas atacamensis]MBJ7372599.1 DUF3077 domain-containing protein [Pseudomonas sp.]PYB91338.1 hypothetical protein DMX03_03895 [Pseudomonas koreensis]PYB99654.1 hypothetical protein DMX04_16920 [Pseudomonas koreensis]